VTVERAGGTLDLEVVPEKSSTGIFSSRLILGIVNQPPSTELQAQVERAYFLHKYGLVDGFAAAASEMWRLTRSTVGLLGRMLTGTASVKNLSGPISIAQFAGQSAKLGLSRFLDFLGLVSISLGILNLLPIPLLDGGHLLYYLLEFVTRRPVPETVQIFGQQIGFVLLLGLMGLAVFNDIMRMM